MIDAISFLWGMTAGIFIFGIAGTIAYTWAVKKQIMVTYGR
jgi:hypothetical protein